MRLLPKSILVCFVCLGLGGFPETDGFLDPLPDEDPGLRGLGEQEYEYIRRVTRLLDLRGSVLGEYLKGARMPEIESVTNLNLELIKDNLFSDQFAVEKMLLGRASPENMTFDAAYNECRIDYAQFVEPITNTLLQLYKDSRCSNLSLPNIICELLPPYIEPKSQSSWGSKMIDAMGKIPEGIVEGKLHWVGGFDFCLDQKINYTYFADNSSEGVQRNFTGQYCRLDMSSNRLLSQNVDLPLQLGVCVPSTCKPENVSFYISEDNIVLSYVLNEVLNMTITEVYCGQVLDSSTDIPFQAGLGVLLTFLILGILCTIYDGSFRIMVVEKQLRKISEGSLEKLENKEKIDLEHLDKESIGIWHRLELVAVGFSWYSNIRKIFNTRAKPYHLPVLNGMRYLTYVWVVCGNTYVFGPLYQESWTSANIVTALLELPKKFKFQVVINYHLNTDSFLLISGVLITYWFLKRVERNDNKLSFRIIIHYILHRFWRMFPAMMLTLMFYTCFYRYFADGPLFPKDIGDAGNCRVNWWVDMLMVHNLVRTEYLCLTWLFYIPLIFQLHVFFLIALVPLVIFPIVGYVLLAAMFIAHIGATAAISTELRQNDDAGGLFTQYYLTPWCRAGPAIIGLCVGIFLHKTKCQLKMHWAITLVGWLCALGTMAAVVFSSFSEFKEGGAWWPDAAHVAYDTIARSAWAAALGWVVVACSTGHGGVIGKFLGWDLFMPLSRIVFITFCTSAMMIFRYVYTNRILLYVHDYHMRYIIFGHLFYVTIMGLFFGLLWHYPASIGVEKAICCKTFSQWILAGRHPKTLTDELYKKKRD